MRKRKVIARTILTLLLLIITYGVWYAWRAFPIIRGYGSKNMCSAIFLQHRNIRDVLREDLGDFPLSLGTFTVNPCSADARKYYGYQFWLNGLDKTNLSKKWYPDVPSDMFFCDGYGGQGVYIIPSKKLVIVRMGLHMIEENKFLKEVIAAVNR